MKKDFVKNIGTALKQIKEGKGLTKKQVFEKRDKQLENKVAKDIIADGIVRVLKKEHPLVIDMITEKLEQENAELKETLDIMSDKKIMKRFKQKSEGKNISLREMNKKGITNLFCIDEKDRCKSCNKKIWKDKFITKTKDGYLCEKCKKKGGKRASSHN